MVNTRRVVLSVGFFVLTQSSIMATEKAKVTVGQCVENWHEEMPDLFSFEKEGSKEKVVSFFSQLAESNKHLSSNDVTGYTGVNLYSDALKLALDDENLSRDIVTALCMIVAWELSVSPKKAYFLKTDTQRVVGGALFICLKNKAQKLFEKEQEQQQPSLPGKKTSCCIQ